MKTFQLPDLGEGLTEAEIVTWHVAPGDHVVADQPLLSVETAKAVVDIPAPWSGNVAKLMAEVGDIVETGNALIEFDTAAREDSGAIVGELPVSEESPSKSENSVMASPAIRKLARERGINLETINGSGPQGAILRKDLDGIFKKEPESDSKRKSDDEPVRGVRRSMSQVMTKAGREVVPATVTEEADIYCWSADSNILVRVIRAMQAAVKAEPGLNAWYFPESGTRKLLSQLSPGIAVDHDDGLFVPTLQQVETLSDERLKVALQELRDRISSRTVSPAEMKNQSITLSNFGALGGIHASLVVVPPQVAILGIGRKISRPVAVEDAVGIHPILPLSLTFDHRVVTGGEATRFLAAVIRSLEQPTSRSET